jgi:glycosyltransferase involved in cell wall biosynthesis
VPHLPDLLRFVWLSRGDLPAEMDPVTSEGHRNFLFWWMFYGRHEFPAVARLLPPDTYAPLFLPAEDGNAPLATFLWRQRADLQSDIALGDPRLGAWLFVHGMDEYGLRPLIGPQVQDWLGQPTGVFRLLRMVALLRADLAGLDDSALIEWWIFHGRDEFPAAAELLPADSHSALFLPASDGISPLAAAIWRRRPDLQADFPLGDPRLEAWLFIYGVGQCGLRPLIGPLILDWLCQPIAGVLRLVRMVALLRDDLAGLDDRALFDWWIFHGRHEHPAAAQLISPESYAALFQHTADGPPPLAATLWRQRQDLQADMRLDDPRLEAWLFVCGIDEYGLRPLMGPRVLDWLCQPITGVVRLIRMVARLRPSLSARDDSALLMWWFLSGRLEFPAVAQLLPPDAYDSVFLPAKDALPPLAEAFWHEQEDLRAEFTLDTPKLEAWLFVHGVGQHGLRPLIGPQVVKWLCQATGAAGIPRLLRMVALLRTDLAGLDDHALLNWWVFHGRYEIPTASPLLLPDAYTPLFLPARDGIPPLAATMWRQRPDLRADMALDDPRLEAWLFVHGVAEYDLHPLIGPQVREWLCQPMDTAGIPRLLRMVALVRRELAGLDDTAILDWFVFDGLREQDLCALLDDQIVAILGPRVMDAMVRRHPAMPQHFAPGICDRWWPKSPPTGAQLCCRILADPRRRLAGWLLLEGLAEFGLAGHLSAEDRGYLTTPMGPDNVVTPVMALAWYARDDLQAEHDLATPAGRAGLAHWYGNWAAQELPLAAVLADSSRLPAPAIRLPPRQGVNLVGFASGQLGIGEDVRCLAQALESADIPYTIINLNPRSNCQAGDRSAERHVTNLRLYDTNVFCLTGFDTVWAYVQLGPDFFAGMRNIGNWPWELPNWPEPWGFALDFLDEVWGISRFCTECFAKATANPVLWMPSAMRPLAPPSLGRADLGLPDGRFLFTLAFDFNSFLDRKNPMAAIEAFEQAFGEQAFEDGTGPMLAVKVMNADGADPRWRDLRRRVTANPSVVLLEGTWSYERTIALVAASDCYVSLHRSEGFGRGLAEAMALAVPVIATGWSGSTDLTDDGRGLTVDYQIVPVPPGAYPYAEGQVWADPSVAHAAQRMREIVAMGDAARPMVERTKAHVLSYHSVAMAGQRTRARLEQLWRG